MDERFAHFELPRTGFLLSRYQYGVKMAAENGAFRGCFRRAFHRTPTREPRRFRLLRQALTVSSLHVQVVFIFSHRDLFWLLGL